jgi:hypothetical protein
MSFMVYTKEAIMTCSRCSGFMVEEHLLDFDGTYGQMWATGWRCMNCGRIHDSVIEQNQLIGRTQGLAFPSSEPDYQDDEVPLRAEPVMRHAA